MRKRACVLVLGEISQSPRMEFHALSFAENGYAVEIIGHNSNVPYKNITTNKNIKIRPLKKFPIKFKAILFPVYLILRVIWEIGFLLRALKSVSAPDVIIIQNPPSIYIMPIILLVHYCVWKNMKIILDWHNYGYTLLSLKYSHYSLIIGLYKYFESQIGKWVDYNVCVSNAMQRNLKTWNIEATTLYDFPQKFFALSDGIKEKHDVLIKLFNIDTRNKKESLFTVYTPGGISDSCQYKKDRPALVVSSTSWTEDEDFSYLINAMKLYDTMKEEDTASVTYPDILCVVTGKGPLKAYYADLIKSKHFKHVDFRLLWLESEDYPKLLGCADLGICLHNSSSGFDLPMKISDMFGCNLPVIAYDYPTLHEIVKPGHNGLLFSDSRELYERLKELLQNFPAATTDKIGEMRQYINSHKRFWDENWNEVILGGLLSEGSKPNTKKSK